MHDCKKLLEHAFCAVFLTLQGGIEAVMPVAIVKYGKEAFHNLNLAFEEKI